MVNDVTKKYRELMAIGLLGAAVLFFIAALSLLLKSSDELGSSIGFAEKAALYGSAFESGLIILALVGAVVLVTRLGEPSADARIVVLAAMGIGAVDLLFAVITFFAQFGAGSSFSNFDGAPGAGKIVGALLSLAQLIFLAVALLYVYSAFHSLPAPVTAPAQQWGSGQGFGQYGGQPQPPTPAQQPWRQPDQGYPQQGWAQPGQPSGWGPPAGQAQGQPPAWGQPPLPPAAQTWAQPDPSGWGQQQAYSSPAASPPAASAPPESPFWGPPEVAHVQPSDVPEAAQAPTEADASDPSRVGPADSEPAAEPAAVDAPESDDQNPPAAQGWWQHPGQ